MAFTVKKFLASVIKNGEILCGDAWCVTERDMGPAAVLSDGMGSGVKANILATLTSSILSTLLGKGLSLDEATDTVDASLPVCRERRIAYATFAAAVFDGDLCDIYQYDCPPVLLFRGGKNTVYSGRFRFIGKKEIQESSLELKDGDMLILMTDGITNAGIGKSNLMGWEMKDIIRSLEEWCAEGAAAQDLADRLLAKAIELSGGTADDDTTVMVLQLRVDNTIEE